MGARDAKLQTGADGVRGAATCCFHAPTGPLSPARLSPTLQTRLWQNQTMTYGTLIPDDTICFLLATVSRQHAARPPPPLRTRASWRGQRSRLCQQLQPRPVGPVAAGLCLRAAPCLVPMLSSRIAP